MTTYCPDFSSSEDEFDDPDFKAFVRREQLERYQEFQGNLTEEQQNEQSMRKIQNFIMNGDNEEVLKLINNKELGLNEKKFPDHQSPICFAASVGNYDLVRTFCEMGADLKGLKGDDTPIISACQCPPDRTTIEKTVEIIKYLMDKGVNVQTFNKRRMNALMAAASNGNLELVEFLIPSSDLTETDYQSWDVFFWAVYSGNISLVEFLIKEGIKSDYRDLHGETPLDLAVKKNFQDIIDLIKPEEEENYNYLKHSQIDFVKTFENLKDGERPIFIEDIYNFLHGTRCGNIMKFFINENIGLFDVLTATEKQFEIIGVAMPFQRKRLMWGIHKFHKAPFHPNSIPFIGQEEIFSNIDVAAEILTCIKQLMCMEAALKYIMTNIKNPHQKCLQEDKDIENALRSVDYYLRKMLIMLKKLKIKAAEWDMKVEPVNLITSKSGKRWFPWRKTIVLGFVVALSLKFWKRH